MNDMGGDGTSGTKDPGRGLRMDPEEMRTLGHQVVDLIVRRWETLDESPPWVFGERWELESLLREDPPEEGLGSQEVLQRAIVDVMGRAARVDHPRFFAFVPSGPTWPSVMASLLATGFNTFQGTWWGSSGPSQIELIVLEWFRQWLGLPDGASGVFTSGGSAANLCAVFSAREAAGNPTEPVIYLNDQGHSSLERAAKVVGIQGSGVRRIPTDDEYRMIPEALEASLAEDRMRGRTPVCVCANAGATNTGAVDPLGALADVCRRHEVWFHVDAAYGGFSVLAPGGRERLRGMEEADSIALDPHKWLFQPFETGCIMVRDPAKLQGAFSMQPEYLQDTALGLDHVNFGERGIELSRTFRALRVWMSVQSLGLRAFREAIQKGIELAERAGEYAEGAEFLELLSPPSLGIVCFRYRPPGRDVPEHSLAELNRRIQTRILGEGVAATSSTLLKGRYSLRICILNYTTEWHDVERTMEMIRRAGDELARELDV